MSPLSPPCSVSPCYGVSICVHLAEACGRAAAPDRVLRPPAIDYSDGAILEAQRLLLTITAFLEDARAYLRGQLLCAPVREAELWGRWVRAGGHRGSWWLWPGFLGRGTQGPVASPLQPQLHQAGCEGSSGR